MSERATRDSEIAARARQWLLSTTNATLCTRCSDEELPDWPFGSLAPFALTETGAPKATLVWLQSYMEHERVVFGDDPWPYGFEANRKTIEALAAYVYEQGLAERLVLPQSLFAAETLGIDDRAIAAQH